MYSARYKAMPLFINIEIQKVLQMACHVSPSNAYLLLVLPNSYHILYICPSGH